MTETRIISEVESREMVDWGSLNLSVWLTLVRLTLPAYFCYPDSKMEKFYGAYGFLNQERRRVFPEMSLRYLEPVLNVCLDKRWTGIQG